MIGRAKVRIAIKSRSTIRAGPKLTSTSTQAVMTEPRIGNRGATTDMSDRTVERNEILGLTVGERFLLWAVRLWVKNQQNGGESANSLYDGFCSMRLEEGYLLLDELMGIVGTATTRTIDVRCPHCPGFSTDEQILIGVVTALQKGDFRASERLLGVWLPPAAVRMAQRPAARIASLMEKGGLTLRPQEHFAAMTQDGNPRKLSNPNLHDTHATVQ